MIKTYDDSTHLAVPKSLIDDAEEIFFSDDIPSEDAQDLFQWFKASFAAAPEAPQQEQAPVDDVPYPGMAEAFEAYYSQSFADKDWLRESGVWAAAWKTALRSSPQQEQAPVAFVQADPDGHLILTEITKTAEGQQLDQWDRQMGWTLVPLYREPPDLAARVAELQSEIDSWQKATAEIENKWLDKCDENANLTEQAKALEIERDKYMHSMQVEILAKLKLAEQVKVFEKLMRWYMPTMPVEHQRHINESLAKLGGA